MTLNSVKKRRMIPLAIFAFFGIVILVNSVVVMLAVNSHPGVETDQAYEKGRLYNQTIALAEDGKSLGWQVSLGFESDEKGVTLFNVLTLDKYDNSLNDLVITGLIVRPVSDGADIPVIFQARSQGHYSASLNLPFPGQWEVRLLITGPDGESAQYIQRVNLP